MSACGALDCQADRLEELGAAKQVPGKLLREGPAGEAASRLAGSLGRVLRSDSMRARCLDLQTRLRQEDGAAVASRHISEALQDLQLQNFQSTAAPGAEVFRLANGWPVRTASLAEAIFLYEEIFVQQCYLQHGLALRPGDVIVDVGANIGAAKGPPVALFPGNGLRHCVTAVLLINRAGMFALWLMSSAEAAPAACYSLEPAAPSFELLQENLRAAGLQEKVLLPSVFRRGHANERYVIKVMHVCG